jgi:hypothetical protein
MPNRAVRRRQAIQKIDLVREAKIIRGLRERAAKRFVADVVAIGKRLEKIKAGLGHGPFLAWLTKHLKMSADTAENYMAAARISGKFRTLRNLEATALYMLARPSMPPEVRDEVIRRHEAGDKVTPKMVKLAVEVQRQTVLAPYYRVDNPEDDPPTRHTVLKPVYDEPPPRLLPAPSEPEPEPQSSEADAAVAFIDALAAMRRMPDIVAEAYRAKVQKLSVKDLREFADAVEKHVAKLLDDATPGAPPLVRH